MTDQQLLIELANSEGFADADEFIEFFAMDDIVPGICVLPDCGYTTSVEPDCDACWCEYCQQPTVKSGLILGEIF